MSSFLRRAGDPLGRGLGLDLRGPRRGFAVGAAVVIVVW